MDLDTDDMIIITRAHSTCSFVFFCSLLEEINVHSYSGTSEPLGTLNPTQIHIYIVVNLVRAEPNS